MEMQEIDNPFAMRDYEAPQVQVAPVQPYPQPYQQPVEQTQPRATKKYRVIEIDCSMGVFIMIGIFLFYLFIPKGYQTYNFLDLVKK